MGVTGGETVTPKDANAPAVDQAGGAPLGPRTSTSSTAISVEVQVAQPEIEHDAHTLRTRPWRLRSTPFKSLVDHPYRGQGTLEQPYILEWLPLDHENPQTFGIVYKWVVIMTVAIATLAVALASSAYADIIKVFGASQIVVILGVSLFVLGFALGVLPRTLALENGFIASLPLSSRCLWLLTACELCILIPETYAPTLLRRRAALLQEVTGKVYRAPTDAKGLLSVKQLMKTSLTRPWKLLFTEPIVAAISLYMACIYGTLYMLFAAFPIVFQQGRGWNAGVGGLAFIGMMFAVLWTIFYENPRYIRVATASSGGRAAPESRLPPGIMGGVLLIIGLVWFAASCGPAVFWIVPIMAGAPFGAGLVMVFLSMMNYLIDSYTIYAASVLAANSVLRSLFGAAFPLFTGDMYTALGVNWASAVPAFLAFACFPFSIIFWKYGVKIRSKSKMSAEADRIMATMMRPRDPAPEATKEEV
ncbi:hypothetical protein RQP46_001252 [Phenoliferia psychrophenolica]